MKILNKNSFCSNFQIFTINTITNSFSLKKVHLTTWKDQQEYRIVNRILLVFFIFTCFRCIAIIKTHKIITIVITIDIFIQVSDFWSVKCERYNLSDYVIPKFYNSEMNQNVFCKLITARQIQNSPLSSRYTY